MINTSGQLGIYKVTPVQHNSTTFLFVCEALDTTTRHADFLFMGFSRSIEIFPLEKLSRWNNVTRVNASLIFTLISVISLPLFIYIYSISSIINFMAPDNDNTYEENVTVQFGGSSINELEWNVVKRNGAVVMVRRNMRETASLHLQVGFNRIRCYYYYFTKRP